MMEMRTYQGVIEVFKQKSGGVHQDASYARQRGFYRSKGAYIRMWWSEIEYKGVSCRESCVSLRQV